MKHFPRVAYQQFAWLSYSLYTIPGRWEVVTVILFNNHATCCAFHDRATRWISVEAFRRITTTSSADCPLLTSYYYASLTLPLTTPAEISEWSWPFGSFHFLTQPCVTPRTIQYPVFSTFCLILTKYCRSFFEVEAEARDRAARSGQYAVSTMSLSWTVSFLLYNIYIVELCARVRSGCSCSQFDRQDQTFLASDGFVYMLKALWRPLCNGSRLTFALFSLLKSLKTLQNTFLHF